jgi:hypothetical protein
MGTGAPGAESVETKTMMTMAGLAYGDPDLLRRYLRDDVLTRGAWEATWIAESLEDPVTFAFLARHRDTGAYVLSIRGTYPNPFNRAYWNDGNLDKPFGPMQPWPGAESQSAKVSKGAWTAFQDLLDLKNGKTTTPQQTTLKQELQRLPAGTVLSITGHSLGGTLAPVIALWLSEQANAVVATVFAFAGMTPGNRQFARLFGAGTALANRVFRYNNRLDTVPYGWDRVWQTHDFYQPKPRGGIIVALIVGVTKLFLIPYGFAAIGEEVVLEGKLLPTAVDTGLIAYLLENLSQHLPGTYLTLLKAPPLPFTMEFVSLVETRTPASADGSPPPGPLRIKTRYR